MGHFLLDILLEFIGVIARCIVGSRLVLGDSRVLNSRCLLNFHSAIHLWLGFGDLLLDLLFMLLGSRDGRGGDRGKSRLDLGQRLALSLVRNEATSEELLNHGLNALITFLLRRLHALRAGLDAVAANVALLEFLERLEDALRVILQGNNGLLTEHVAVLLLEIIAGGARVSIRRVSELVGEHLAHLLVQVGLRRHEGILLLWRAGLAHHRFGHVNRGSYSKGVNLRSLLLIITEKIVEEVHFARVGRLLSLTGCEDVATLLCLRHLLTNETLSTVGLLDKLSQLLLLVGLASNDLSAGRDDLSEDSHLGLMIQCEHGLVEDLTAVNGLTLRQSCASLSSILTAFLELWLTPEVQSGQALLSREQLLAVRLEANETGLLIVTRVVVHDLVQLRLQLKTRRVQLLDEVGELLRLEQIVVAHIWLGGELQGLVRLDLLLAEVTENVQVVVVLVLGRQRHEVVEWRVDVDRHGRLAHLSQLTEALHKALLLRLGRLGFTLGSELGL